MTGLSRSTIYRYEGAAIFPKGAAGDAQSSAHVNAWVNRAHEPRKGQCNCRLPGPAAGHYPNWRPPRRRSRATPYRGQLDPNGSLQLWGVLPVSRVFDNVTLPSSEREIPPPATSARFPTMNELLKVPCGSSPVT